MAKNTRRLSLRVTATVLVPLLCLGPSLPASAQIEEIVVTATKREENVQDVPVAVTVLSSDTIDAASAVGFEGLQALIPSASFRKGNTTRNSSVIVRGLGTISFSTAAEPSVATVVDGVVLGRSGQAFGDLYELERLEVLRGPQGTLFGKNASAGVVNITTRRPSDEFEGMVDLSFFQDNETRLKGRVSGPLGDNARGSITAFKGDFDGFIRNVYNNETTNGYDRSGIRAMLEYEPTDTISALFIYEDYDAVDECCADIEGLPSGRNPASEAAPNSNGVVNGVADIDLDQRLVDHDLTTITLDSTTAFSAQIDVDIGDKTLTSITARRTWNNTEIREGDFTSIGGTSDLPVFGVPFQLHDVGPQEWRQLSQELRLASPGGETFDWQIGLFYWNIDSERNFTRDASCQNNGGQNQPILDANPGLTCNANDIVSATAFFDTEFNNFALFGEGTYNISDELRLIFGLRITEDEVSFNHNRRNNDEFGRQGVGVRPAAPNSQFSAASGGYDSNFSGETDESNTSGKIGVQWSTDTAGMFYGTYSQGYKGPAFNTFYNMGANDVLPIGAEESDAFELGWKYTGDSFLLNLSVFRTEVENFQANNFDTSTGVTITRLTNAGDVSTEGFEVDFLWRPMDNLSIGGGFASVDATIDRFNCPVDPGTGQIPPGCSTRSGLDVPFSPDLKVSLFGEWLVELDSMDLVFNGSYVHTDEQYSDLPNTSGSFAPAALLPEYDVLNLTASLSFNDDQFRISLIGKNLTDESYVTTFSGDGFRYQVPRDADRYFGIGLRAEF
ncbi:MAG: TonB-dependent receptor [Woeseiaceae bacterium]|nr:TonB-dependent receptor [Woeseiaceae bacterium]